MSVKRKLIVAYAGGVVSGIVLTIAIAFCLAALNRSRENGANGEEGVQLFESPRQVVNAESFRVIQVTPSGNALAVYTELSSREGCPEYGTVVLFLADEKTSYYDDKVIPLPKGKCFRQMGTYRYTTRENVEKTVPVLGIYDERTSN